MTEFRIQESNVLTIPVKELMTAAPPVNNIAVTRMLVMIPKTAKTLKKLVIRLLKSFGIAYK